MPNKMARLYRHYNARYGAMALLAIVIGSLMGLPILKFVAELSITLLNLITLV